MRIRFWKQSSTQLIVSDLGLDMWDYDYDHRLPKREIPRFVPPIKIEYVEGQKLNLEAASSELHITEEYTWAIQSLDQMTISDTTQGEKVCL